jgi:hypothetical protein
MVMLSLWLVSLFGSCAKRGGFGPSHGQILSGLFSVEYGFVPLVKR